VQLHHAALVRIYFSEVQGGVALELIEKRDPLADQYGLDRIAHFVGEPEAKASAGYGATADGPDTSPTHAFRGR
jgi:hypothetical protein